MSHLGDLSVAIPLAALCVMIAGFCAGTEVALFSLRRVDREQLARSESRRDRRVMGLLERPRRLIATVSIGHEACAAGLAVLAVVFLEANLPAGAPWAIAALALAATLPLVVLLGEVTAKTLAAKAPLAWSRTAALPLWMFLVAVTPVRVIVSGLAELVLRPLGVAARTRPQRDMSEQEFRSLVDAGAGQGAVDARERRLIHRVFEFSDKNVGQVMTPRERIFGLSYDLPMQRIVRELATRGFSRVPVYQKSLDNVRGIVNAKDLVRAAAGQPVTQPLGALLHEPLFVPRTTPVKRLFLTFKQKKVHMAIVVSEYGKVLGLVTMDDLLGLIFGHLRDERAELQQSMPGIRLPRTPARGVEVMPEGGGDNLIDTGPVSMRPASEPADHSAPESPSSEPVEALDPPPAPHKSGHLRPIHPPDELTPPAVDLDELARMREKR